MFSKEQLDQLETPCYIFDETEIVHYIKENNEQRLDIGLLYIDNYDESLEPIDEVRRSLLAALIERKINKYMLKIDAITKKLEKNLGMKEETQTHTLLRNITPTQERSAISWSTW